MNQSNMYASKFSPEAIVEARKKEQAESAKRLSLFTKFHISVDKVLFRSTDSSFAIAIVTSKKPQGTFGMKTTFPTIAEGGVYDVEGHWEDSKNYGKQLVTSKVSLAAPDDEYGMITYLSNNIDGLGPKSARMVVKYFGLKAQTILDNNPTKLYDVPGIKRKQVEKAIKSWSESKEVNKLYTYLTSIRVNASNCRKIYEKYGKMSIEKIKENPYCLTEIDGIGFTTADNIAKNMGLKADNPFRIRSGIIYSLVQKAQNEGNVYMPYDALVEEAAKELKIVEDNDSIVRNELDYLIKNEKVATANNGKAIYTNKLFEAEIVTSYRLYGLLNASAKPVSVSDDLGKEYGITYDDIQMDAIRTAMDSKVMVLTGGPGTGKTTTTKGIISAWKAAGLKILLAAPTGRAAKRLSEATGMEASTIHRMLGYMGKTFTYNAEKKLEGDALIVDEASMVDIELMKALLVAMPDNMRLVLVGDVDQLPSVGPGNVLRDCIESGVIPVVKLTRIFRQAQDSRIVTNAHLIDEGKPIVYDNSEGSDFFFLQDDNNDCISVKILDMVVNRLPKYYGVAPMDIQVLAAMKKSSNGVASLNKMLQAAINPRGKVFEYNRSFREGDKVMQMKNDYDNDVFNGDMGVVASVDNDDDVLYVDFGKKDLVEYDKKNLENLALAYACTIHKSQGSEYKIVVMPFTTQFYPMLKRNLLYTGVTRAKKVCVLVGSKKALNMAIRNGSAAKRYTLLKERLRYLYYVP